MATQTFDPDAYLAANAKQSVPPPAFDPDAYLSTVDQAVDAARTVPGVATSYLNTVGGASAQFGKQEEANQPKWWQAGGSGKAPLNREGMQQYLASPEGTGLQALANAVGVRKGEIMSDADYFQYIQPTVTAPPTGVIPATESLIEKGRRAISPIAGPTESQKMEDAVPVTDAQGNTTYEYKPAANEIEKRGLLPAITDAGSAMVDLPSVMQLNAQGKGTTLTDIDEQRQKQYLKPDSNDSDAMQVWKAVHNSVLSTAHGVANPVWSFVPQSRLLSGAFAVDMTKSGVQQYLAANDADNVQDKVQGYLGALMSLSFGAAATSHAIKGHAPLPEEARKELPKIVESAPNEALQAALADPTLSARIHPEIRSQIALQLASRYARPEAGQGKPVGFAEMLDGLTLARRKLLEDFKTLDPATQEVHQGEVDKIDEQLLAHDRTAVNESAARTAQPGPRTGTPEPPAVGEVPGSPQPKPNLFQQLRQQQTVAPIIDATEQLKAAGADKTAAVAEQIAETIKGKSSPPEEIAPEGKAAAEEPEAVKPTIQTPAGEVTTGEDHVAAYEKAKETTPDTSGSKEGFQDADGNFISREEAARKTGLPTQTEEGKLHSSDLPTDETTQPPVETPPTEPPPTPAEPAPAPSGVEASPGAGVRISPEEYTSGQLKDIEDLLGDEGETAPAAETPAQAKDSARKSVADTALSELQKVLPKGVGESTKRELANAFTDGGALVDDFPKMLEMALEGHPEIPKEQVAAARATVEKAVQDYYESLPDSEKGKVQRSQRAQVGGEPFGSPAPKSKSPAEVIAALQDELDQARADDRTHDITRLKKRIKELKANTVPKGEETTSAEPTPSEPPAKTEPWQKTREEISDAGGSLAAHRLAVRAAVKAGEPVPLDVLESYKGTPWADAARKKMYGKEISDSWKDDHWLNKLIDNLKDEDGNTYADPLFIQSVGKPALRAAAKLIREGIDAGKLVVDAVTDAVNYLKSINPKVDEEKARDFFLGPHKEKPSATPRETEAPAPDTTALKRATVDAEAKAAGRPEIPTEVRPKDEQIVADAKARLDADPTLAKTLVSDIVDDGKTGITEQDAATLLVERRRLRNERQKWEEIAGDDQSSSTQRGQAKGELDRIEGEQFRLDQAGRAAGREWSDVGRMYQREIAADFSLEALERKARVAKGGSLSPEELASLKEKAANYEEAQKRADSLEGKASEGEAFEEMAKIYEQLVDEVSKEGKPSSSPATKKTSIPQKVIDYAKNARESALERIRQRRAQGRLNALPVNELIDYGIVGASYIMEGAAKGAKWTKQMVDTFGEEIKPFLKEIRAASEEQVENLTKQATEKKPQTVAQAKAGLKAAAVAGGMMDPKSLADLVRAHVREGLTGEDEVMAAVHKDVQEISPEATERDVRRALVKYGSEVKPPTRDAVETRVRQLKSLVKIEEDIKNLQEGQPTWKSQIRDKRTQELRDKIKIRTNLLKQLDLPESEESLASRSQARATALENRIKDIERELKTGERSPENAPVTRTPREEDLMMERDALQEKLNEVRAESRPKPTSEDIAAEQAQKGVDAAAASLDRWDRILKGEVTPEGKTPTEAKSALEEEIRSQVEAMKTAHRELEKAAKPETDAEAVRQKAQLKSLEKAIAEYERRAREVDLEPKGKRQGPDTEQIAKAKAARDAAKKVVEDMRKARKTVKSPEERYNETRMKQVEKMIADAKDRLARRDYSPKPKATPLAKTAEVAKAEADLRKLRQDIQNDLGKIAYEKRGTASKAVEAVNKLVTGLKVVGHGTVGMITHAGGLLYRPELSTQKIWWQNFGRQFGMWAKPEFHEQLIHQMVKDPEFQEWKDAGASIDPEKNYTDYGLYVDALKHLSEKGGKVGKAAAHFLEGGQRGFDALKLARLELNKAAWEKVSPEIKADPAQAKEMRRYIAEMNNKATGAIPSKVNPVGKSVEEGIYNLAKNPGADIAFFAPRLYASRWGRIVVDPIKTVGTFTNWKNASPAERAIAVKRTGNAAKFAVGYVGALAVNQAILSATGSGQKVNMTDPTKPDWLKFKGFGKEFVADGGLLDPVRLLGQIVIGDLVQDKAWRGESGAGKVGSDLWKYLRGKFNPSVGLMLDEGTGRDFSGRPLPQGKTAFGLGADIPDTEKKPKYSWGEWLAQQGPIPLSGGVKVAYDQMRKEGMSHLDAMKLLKGAAIAVLGMTGAHIGDDHTEEQEAAASPARTYNRRNLIPRRRRQPVSP